MTRPRPVTIRGKTYPSHGAAAADIGTTRAAISQAKRRGRLNSVGLSHPASVETTVDGVTYPSRAEASRQTGVPYVSLRIFTRGGEA